MQFYARRHKLYCGVDLYARTMYLCVIDRKGDIPARKNLPTDREAFLKVIEP